MSGRKKKSPGYDADRIFKEFKDAVVSAYRDGNQEKPVSLRFLADEFDTTILKIRKVLITAGEYRTDISDTVNILKDQGLSVTEIMQETNLSRASVHSYLPYTKGIYQAPEISANAERLRVYWRRKACVNQLREAMDAREVPEDILWETVEVFAGYPFSTVKGKRFSYSVKGYEIFVDRKKKSITKATVMLFAERVREIQHSGEKITGPKKVGTFGASYLFLIFLRFGLIEIV